MDFLSSCYYNLHCRDRKFSFEMSFNSSFSSLFEPRPGLRILISPIVEHWSLSPSSSSPIHHAPGVNEPFFLPNNTLSILSKTGSSALNLRAKGAPLFVMFLKCDSVSVRGCCFGGLSHLM